MKYWEILIVRIVAYIALVFILSGFWALAHAQSTTTCRQQGGQIVCSTVPQQTGPGFDPSVIAGIGDTNRMSPEMIHYLWMKKCIKLGVKEGLTDDEIRARCFR